MKKKSIIKLSITAVILIALGCWINSRWNAWFGNPPEAVYSPLNEPGRILLTFGDENALSRNISWQYDSIVYPSHVLIPSLKIPYILMQQAKSSNPVVERQLTTSPDYAP